MLQFEDINRQKSEIEKNNQNCLLESAKIKTMLEEKNLKIIQLGEEIELLKKTVCEKDKLISLSCVEAKEVMNFDFIVLLF
jgi:hypothetical protein